MEKKIFFAGVDVELEGLLDRKIGTRGVVVTHPHPLYGGDMYNLVVETVARAYQQNGLTTLRFNFRGVGESQGRYSEGVDEPKDVVAALAYLRQMGVRQVDLAGYSFGSWVNARLNTENAGYDQMIMVSPPVALMDFDPALTLPSLRLVVTGSQDDFAPPDQIRARIGTWNPDARLAIIEGADHFYSGCLQELASVLSAAI